MHLNMGAGSSTDWQERLYREKAAELILYGRALGLTHAEAEDVAQDVFLALLARPTAPDNPTHYLVRSFRNRAFNYRRTLWRRLAREFESQRWFDRDPGESPAERAAMRCLEQLPPAQREVIVLKLWHDFTFEAIGELLELSPHTAAGRYRYGLEKLRACLKGEEHERDEPTGNPITLVDTPPSIGPA
jgi:RNA polymerase sigma-70 factor (ECF subfamily)